MKKNPIFIDLFSIISVATRPYIVINPNDTGAQGIEISSKAFADKDEALEYLIELENPAAALFEFTNCEVTSVKEIIEGEKPKVLLKTMEFTRNPLILSDSSEDEDLTTEYCALSGRLRDVENKISGEYNWDQNFVNRGLTEIGDLIHDLDMTEKHLAHNLFGKYYETVRKIKAQADRKQENKSK